MRLHAGDDGASLLVKITCEACGTGEVVVAEHRRIARVAFRRDGWSIDEWGSTFCSACAVTG